jgi:hypothetical protein
VLGQLGPYLVVIPLVTLVFALYGTMVPFGALGYFGGALAGLAWSLLAGLIATWLNHRISIAIWSADASLFGCAIATGLLAGAGIMYVLLFSSVLREPSTTHAVISAMMKPTVPFYIALNSAMEIFFIPLVVFLNRHAQPARRWILVASATIYLIQRVWTYLVYTKQRFATGTSPLSEADLAWFRKTLKTDYRVVLNVMIFAFFAAAAFLPLSPI